MKPAVFTHEKTNDIPDNFDSREHWPKCDSIKEIRDQANCGSCWAFGASEAMSDRLCISSGQKDQTRISAADILSCCDSCGNGCGGGFPPAAWDFYQQTGVVTGDLYGDKKFCYPYQLKPCAHHVNSTKYPACPAEVDTPQCNKKCQEGYSKNYKDDKIHGGKSQSFQGIE